MDYECRVEEKDENGSHINDVLGGYLSGEELHKDLHGHEGVDRGNRPNNGDYVLK